MKIVTFEMPIGVARARAKKWWLKASNVDFIYNANKTKARLVINADKHSTANKQYLLMSMLPCTNRGLTKTLAKTHAELDFRSGIWQQEASSYTKTKIAVS